MRTYELELAYTLRFSVWGLRENLSQTLTVAPVEVDWAPLTSGDVHGAFKDLEDLELILSSSSGDKAIRIGRVGNPLREVKVLVTTDESVFIEELDGTRSRRWLPIDQLVILRVHCLQCPMLIFLLS
jgi:hypothetical protein